MFLHFIYATFFFDKRNTVCPRSSDPFYVVTYHIKWVTTSWTDGNIYKNFQLERLGDLSNGGSIEGSAAFNIDQLISTSEQQNSKKQPWSLAESATLICPDGVSNMFLEISGMQFVKDGKVFARVLDVLIANLQ